jgi:hypothetical protein
MVESFAADPRQLTQALDHSLRACPGRVECFGKDSFRNWNVKHFIIDWEMTLTLCWCAVVCLTLHLSHAGDKPPGGKAIEIESTGGSGG